MVYEVIWDTDHSGRDHFTLAEARTPFMHLTSLFNPVCPELNSGNVQATVVSGTSPYTFFLYRSGGVLERSWRSEQAATEVQQLNPGAYSLTLRDQAGREQSLSFSLTVADDPGLNLGGDVVLAAGSKVMLDATSQTIAQESFTWKWEREGRFLSGHAALSVTEPGTYIVTATRHSDGCTFTDAINVMRDSGSTAVFPSASADKRFNVRIHLPLPGPVQVNTYSESGILIGSWSGIGQSSYETISTVPTAGLYVISIQTPQGSRIHKVVAW